MNQRWRAPLIALGLILATLAAYLPSLSNQFIWDDPLWITDNPLLRTPQGLRDIWFDVGSFPQWYPLVLSVLWLQYQLWHLDPLGYHLVNVLVHALAAVTLWRMLLKLELPGPAALAAAAVFALHPVHVESVAWATELKNVLSGLFYLLAANLLVPVLVLPRDGVPPSQRWRYLAGMALFIAALMSKTVTCSLPAALTLLIYWKHSRISWRQAIQLAPLFALGLIFAVITATMERRHVGAMGVEWDFTFAQRCLIASRAIWFYATKVLWPWPLIFNYPRWTIDAAQLVQWLYPAGVLAAIALLWFCRRRLGRGPLIAALFFMGTLVPALGFFNVYPMRYSFVADHFQYLASLGVSVPAIVLLWRWLPRYAPAISIAACIMLATITWNYSYAYYDEETLWLDTLAKNPQSHLAANNLGSFLLDRGQVEQARELFERALASYPLFTEARNNLGSALHRLGQPDAALQHFQAVIAQDPEEPDPYNNIGAILCERGQFEQALPLFARTLELKPNHAGAQRNLGLALASLGRFEDASHYLQLAVGNRPTDTDTRLQLARVLATLERWDLAAAHLRVICELQPADALPRFRLGQILLQQGETAAAARALEHAQQLAQEQNLPTDQQQQIDAALQQARGPNSPSR